MARDGVSASDVKVLSIGTLATAVAAIEHGQVDAAVLNEVEYLMLRKRGVAPAVLVDGRGPENSKRVYGVREYPTAVLLATGPWLAQHADTARRIVRAIDSTIRWMRGQSPASVAAKIPSQYRGDPDIDVAALSTVLPMFSESGRMSAEGADAVKRVTSVSLDSIRNSTFDLSRTYTDEFRTSE
jgi:NitT/TauT family transport system substrate-binding protein